MNKKAGIWISAVLYMALGIVILTIVLAAGLPVIQKMKDRQTLVQTKDIMNTLDQNIRVVYNEGPSSKRTVDVKIGRGKFIIDQDLDTIHWELKTKALLSEPDVQITEGNLKILTEKTSIKGDYMVSLDLNYSSIIDITYSDIQNTISGTNKLSILNEGSGGGELTRISITKL